MYPLTASNAGNYTCQAIDLSSACTWSFNQVTLRYALDWRMLALARDDGSGNGRSKPKNARL